MAVLQWDQIGERFYETGVDHGVLYIPDNTGAYPVGVAWSGLVGVTETPSGGEPSAQWADNIKYLNLSGAEEFGGTIEAFTYPPEFDQFDGLAEIAPGVTAAQQNRKIFGFAYRTRKGNDVDGSDHGYKLHLVYGAQVSPSERAYTTINDAPEPITLSWTFTTTPVVVPDLKPTALIVLDSTMVDTDNLADLEQILYGTALVDARLPLPEEVIAIMGPGATSVATVAPTYNSTTDIITIPSVTGVVYQVDGETVPSGDFGPITEDTLVTAVPATGYVFTVDSDNDWAFEFV